MKNHIFVILSLVLILLVLPSCSSNGSSAENDYNTDNSLLYKTALERYFNAYIQADLDALLDSLDPDGPLYPDPDDIQNLRDTAAGNSYEGKVVVSDISILEEGDGRARIKAKLYMAIDLYDNGQYQEQESYFIFELTLKGGKWRLNNAIEE
ncbi:MAG: hypothetical protein A2Y58_03950 [Chloroflexi bacterium RBG_13_51_52]|nr:MAG: hypothetical protein A2Y58_03950 [Chloroflexi bacterium RBG_13_51_52]